MVYRVLLADDHQIVVDALASLLNSQQDFEVVGKALDGTAAIAEVREKRPDAVVIDVSMPGLSGVEATRKIRAISSEVSIVCLSMHKDAEIVRSMLQAGASAYLLKEDAAAELITALRTVLAGRNYLSPQLADSIFQMMRSHRDGSPMDLLTPRERQVLQLVAEGHSSRDIAKRLVISARTVTSHRENLGEKLGLRSIASLTRYAIRNGMASLED